MSKEWYQFCKDCGKEFGYSDSSYEAALRRGHSRPERCQDHVKQHRLEIDAIACSHFDLVPRRGKPSILGVPYLGHVEHGRRDLSLREIVADSSQMDIGITDSDIRDFYEALRGHQVLVIVGPTGSGKSTYIPYRLIDPLPPYGKDHFTRDGPVIVTQPRIQATRGIPGAVGGMLLGSSIGPGFEIGYRHGDASGRGGGESHDSRNRLIFVTDGTLLNWIADGRIGDFSVIMIDEAHERSCNIDLILGLIKRELQTHPQLRVIVASATIDADRFVKYYEEATSVRLLEFEGKRNHGYDLHWWQGPPVAEEELPLKLADKVLEILSTTSDGGILGFLPGQREIEAAVDRIRSHLGARADIKVLPLYAALGTKQGQEAIQPLGRARIDGKWVTPRRVVIATNVAETSITVPDVSYVVDSGLIKQSEWNPSICRQELVPKRHSKDGCRQRWGRAGRVRYGEAFTLYTREQFESFGDHTPPEITRDCLDDVLLTAKAAGVSDLEAFSWIEDPPENEMTRAVNVISERGLVDPERDLTAEGLELHRLSRSVSRFLDRYDYNSTKRSLDVATLLVLADRYACLIEAVTALAMMPRMGNSLYWPEDGLLLWDNHWDLESKDRVARTQLSLRAGCGDDLDFACKLFALYEGTVLGLPGSRAGDWGERHFINTRNFALVDEARRAVLEPLVRGKRDSELRPIDFSLIPRLRMLMALAWPDRAFQLEHGHPTRLAASDHSPCALGAVVSRHSCGSWNKHETAVVAMMDRDTFMQDKPQECNVGNFLVQLPKKIPERDVAEIAPFISALRGEWNPEKEYARIFADQLAPPESRVRVESSGSAVRLAEVVEIPRPFTPRAAEALDEEEALGPPGLYEQTVMEPDEVANEHEPEDIGEGEIGPEHADLEGDEFVSRSPPSANDGPGSLPVLEGRWLGKKTAREAMIVRWSGENGVPVAVLDPVVRQDALRARAETKFRPGRRIDVVLERAVFDMWPPRLAGFMARHADGLLTPVHLRDLSISLQNPGLRNLEGTRVRLTVLGRDALAGYPLLSLLPEAEVDLEKLLNAGEVEGRVVEIAKEHVYIAIERKGGIVHGCSIPVEAVSKTIDDLAPGTEVTLGVKYRMSEKGEAWVQVQPDLDLSANEAKELNRNGIVCNERRLVCRDPLPLDSVSSLSGSLPRLASHVRRLYANSRELFATILETPRSRQVFEGLYREATGIRDKASKALPETTREKVKELRARISHQYLSPSSRTELHQVLDEAWRIQQGHQDREFLERLRKRYSKGRDAIERRRLQIADLENRIARSHNEEYKLRARGWINEKQQQIWDIERSNRDTLRTIEDIQSRMRE